MPFSDPTPIDPLHGSSSIADAGTSRLAGTTGLASRRRDAGLLFLGAMVGVGLSWAVVRAQAIHPRAVDRVAAEIRSEIVKNHPDLLKDVNPFIDCAVLRQKATGGLVAYLADRSVLMPAFRSDVAFCARAADELLAKSPKTPDANALAADLALPPVASPPLVDLPDINATPGGALTAMPSLSPSFRPPPQAVTPPLSTVMPGDAEPTASASNAAPQFFSATPPVSVGPVADPSGDLGSLMMPTPPPSPLQVVKPPENP